MISGSSIRNNVAGTLCEADIQRFDDRAPEQRCHS